MVRDEIRLIEIHARIKRIGKAYDEEISRLMSFCTMGMSEPEEQLPVFKDYSTEMEALSIELDQIERPWVYTIQ